MSTPTLCPICLLPPEDPTTATPCRHLFCYHCILLWICRSQADCPNCRTRITAIRFSINNTRTEVEIPVLPPPLANAPMIVAAGPLTMVRASTSFPLHILLPVADPASRLIRHYALVILECGRTYLGPHFPPGTTFFAVPGSEKQMIEALEAAGIGRFELGLRHCGGHEDYLEWHRHGEEVQDEDRSEEEEENRDSLQSESASD